MAATWRGLGEREDSRNEAHNPRRPQAESANNLWRWRGERLQNSGQLPARPACFAALQHAPRTGPTRGAGPAVVDRFVQASNHCSAHQMSEGSMQRSLAAVREERYPEPEVGGASVEGFDLIRGNSLQPSSPAREVQFDLPMAPSRRITGICTQVKLRLFVRSIIIFDVENVVVSMELEYDSLRANWFTQCFCLDAPSISSPARANSSQATWIESGVVWPPLICLELDWVGSIWSS